MLEPRHEDARKLLKLICGDTLVTFQTFDDSEMKRPELATIHHGLSDKTHTVLEKINAKGGGVFFTLNQTDGKGRTAKNIVGDVRTLAVDHDAKPVYRVEAFSGATPHAVVESSPGKYHSYLKVSGIPLELFTELQEGLAAAYNGDPKIKDLPRVLRVPGFYHHKGEAFLTRIIDCNPLQRPYTLDEIKRIIAAGPVKPKASEQEGAADPASRIKAKQKARGKSPSFVLPEAITENRNDTLLKYVRSLLAKGVPTKEIETLVYEVFQPRCYEPLPEAELQEACRHALKYHREMETLVAIVPAFVEELNETCFVSREGNKTRVFSEDFDPSLDRCVLTKTSFEDFRNFHDNNLVRVAVDANGNPVMKKKGSMWLSHPDRRQYTGVTLAPPDTTLPEGYYNLWKGYGVEPVAGSWQLMKEHLLHTVCGGEESSYKYLMGWLANCVMHPSVPAEVAVVLRGKKGTGKGILGRYLCKLFSQNSLQIFSAKHLVGNFNSHLRSCIILFADEAFWAGDKQHEGTLKGLITEPYLTIEGKGVDVVMVRNMLHIIMASNSDWVVPSTGDERRFFVLDVSDEHKQDSVHFGAIVNQMDNGGLAAMLNDLLSYDLSRFDVRKVPQTAALLDQKLHSLGGQDEWWYNKLASGELPQCGGWGMVPSEALYEDYIRVVGASGSRKSTQTVFGLALKKLLPTGWPKKVNRYPAFHAQYGEAPRQIYHYHLPDLETCRAHFSAHLGNEIEWPEG